MILLLLATLTQASTLFYAARLSFMFLHVTINLLVIVNKKFGLMLTRRAKAYSSSCLQTVSLSPAISSQFTLGVCAAAEDCKNQ